MLATDARNCARVATFSIASHSTSIVIEPSHSSAANNTLTAEPSGSRPCPSARTG